MRGKVCTKGEYGQGNSSGVLSCPAVRQGVLSFSVIMNYPRVRTDLQHVPSTVEGQLFYTIKDPITGTFFRVREPEFWILSQLDGHTSFETIAAQFAEKFGAALSPQAIEQFADHLGTLAFLETSSSERKVDDAKESQAKKKSALARILYIKIGSVNPAKVLAPLTRWYRPFHSLILFLLAASIILFGHLVLYLNRESFTFDLMSYATVNSIVIILLSLFILVTIHEFAHAVVCKYYGGEVRDMGFMLMYFQPCFYADLSDAWMFPKKSHRLAVTWAGPFAQFVLTALAVIVWRVTVPGTWINHLAAAITVISWVTILFNFNPLIKLDGYYLLSDWVEIPNLRAKSFAYLDYLFQHHVLGWPAERPDATARERTIFLLYAILGMIFSVALVVLFFMTAVRFVHAQFGGVGLGLLLLLVLYTLQPALLALGRGVVRHISVMKSLVSRPLRLVRTLVVIALLFIVLVVIPFPHHVSGDVTVQPIARFDLLLNQFGLLESRVSFGGAVRESKSTFLQTTVDEMSRLDLVPLVRDGQQVQAGDSIAALTSSHVNKEISQAILELQRLNDQLALLQSPPKKEAISQGEAQVRSAKVSRDQAERELNRLKGLADKKLITPEQLESGQTAYDVASAEVSNEESRLRLLKAPPKKEEEAVIRSQISMQETKLQYLRIQAAAQSFTTPISGTAATFATNGSVVSVSEVNKVEVQIPVSDFDIALIDTGQEVKVRVRSNSERPFIGTVVHIPQLATEVNGQARFMVTVQLDNSDGALTSGVSGYAKIVVGKRSLAAQGLRKLKSLLRVEFWSLW